MKKLFITLLSVAIAATTLTSCGEKDDSSNESDLSIGNESPTITAIQNAGNNVECTISSSWLIENYVSIEAIITIEGVENSSHYYTRSAEATATEWGLQITSVDSESGKFYVYFEAPTNNYYSSLPAILTVSILDANGGETTAMRSIKFEEDVVVSVTGIPQDELAGTTPNVTENTVTLPDFNGAAEVDEDSGNYVYVLNISGISNGEDGYLELQGTDDDAQNIWVEFDNMPKGILVEKVSTTTRAMNDIVFLVDNSGSMSEEANAIAASIEAWATELSESGIDAQFGCVGYSGYVTGAIDLTDVSSLSTYLNRSSGTSRTVGFDTTELSSIASYEEYTTTYGECGVVALRYANDNFNFRSGSNRIYVNFTDEPNQTAGDSSNSVEYVNDSSWSGNGTIHSVYSNTSCSTSSDYEDPRLLSTYTGGSSMTVSSDFEGVTLSSLPVSDAIQNSYIIKFTNIETYIGSGLTYELKIVVVDGLVQSAKSTYIQL